MSNARNHFLIVLSSGAWLIAAPAFAQQKPQPPTDAHVKELIQQALQTQAPPETIGRQAGPVVDLSVEDAVKRALERNLDLAVARLEPQLTSLTLAAVYATFRPNLTSTFSTQSAVQLPNSQLQAIGDTINNDNVVWNSGVQQNLRWWGGRYVFNFTNTRTSTTDQAATRNPGYQSNISANFTQPFLRNFKTDPVRTSLLTTRISQEISDITLRTTVINTEAAVRNAYWDLVFGVQNLDAAKQSLELATKLVQDNKSRVEIGTMAPIDVVQAEAEEATRRQTVVGAEATLRNNELTLKRLLVGGTDDELWRATINPVDRPSPVAEPIDLEAAVRNALQNRTDMTISQKTIEANDISIRNLKNQTLPDLNFVANYSLLGRGGTTYDRFPLSQGGGIRQIIPGGYFDALRTIGRFDAPTWQLAVNLSYPIGTSPAEVGLARARVQLQQNQAQLKQTELQIATDVTTVALNVRSLLEAVQASTASRELSEKRLEAMQSKFDVGMATNYEVVQAQRDLADARNSELRSILNYRKSLVEFQRVQVAGGSSRIVSIR